MDAAPATPGRDPAPPAGRWDLRVYAAVFVLFLAAPAVATFLRPSTRKLGGVERAAEFPALSARAWLGGEFQKGFEEWYLQAFIVRKYLVRTANQINYSFFSEITWKESSQIILGKERTLYQANYIAAYNGDDALPEEKIEAFAAGLRRLQNHLEGKDIRFLFFLTPSKASILPEFIPEPTKARPRALLRANYERLLPRLVQHGVHTLDGHALMVSLKETSGYPVFPKGGAHWNYYASFRVTQELISRVESLLGKKMVFLKLDGVRWETQGFGFDGDLARLANLWRPSVFYGSSPYPVVRREVPPEAVRPNVLLVGGSFLELPVLWLKENGVLGEGGEHDWYFRRKAADVDRGLLGRDVVILETNEAHIWNLGFGFIEAVAPVAPARPR